MIIKYVNVLRNFELNLDKNKDLKLSTKNKYKSLIREMIVLYGIDPSLDQLKRFIEHKIKNNQGVAKYALKYYLSFRWRNKTWTELSKCIPKIKQNKVCKQFITPKQATKLIEHIDNPKHRLIAKIQYFTGASATQVIPLKRGQIHKEYQFDRIRFDLIHNNTIKPVYINDSLWDELQTFYFQESDYIFLNCTDKTINHKKIDSYYNYYYKSLREAASYIGLDIATRVLRQSFAQSIKESGIDKLEMKKVLRLNTNQSVDRYFKDEQEKIAQRMLKHQEAL